MKKILLLNGPNLNLLGSREPSIYGHETLMNLEEKITSLGKKHGVEIVCFQSNNEGELIDRLHNAYVESFAGVIFNPAAYTHYSYAIRDAITSTNLPVVEVHISNVHTRETFRHQSVISPVTIGQIVGFGLFGYELAFLALLDFLQRRDLKDGEIK